MDQGHAIWILLVGAAMVLTSAVEGLAGRLRIPAVAVYLALGVLLGEMDARQAVLGETGRHAFALLADIGLVVLLFRVGLECNLGALSEKTYAALVLVSAATCFLAPWALTFLLGRWPQAPHRRGTLP